MVTIKFKACPKCRGDLRLCKDMSGQYLSCLQCGYLKDLVKEPEIQERKPATVTEIRKAA